MTRKWITALAGTFGLLAAPGPIGEEAARAADHRDGPAVQKDPSTDINDVYAWMSNDASKVNLVMTVFPNASTTSKFSNAAAYAFHINAGTAYGDTQPVSSTIICTFDASQKISCFGPQGSMEKVTGDASVTTGITSTSGKMQVFAGLRDDGFFFNVAGFRAAIAGAAGALTKDPGGCPAADAAAAPGLVMVLQSNGKGGAPMDGFMKGGDVVPSYSGNVLAIVVSIDKTLLLGGGKSVLGVWGSTNMIAAAQ